VTTALKRLAAGVQVPPWPPYLYYLLTVAVQNVAQPGTPAVHKGDRNPGQASPCARGGGAIGRVAQLSGKRRENSRRLWSRRDLARNSCRKSTRSEGPRACTRDRDAFPRAVANNTVDGKMVALPCLIDVGLLYYRTDLLRRYGYRTPPRTWRELETMATRIQAGERAKGQNDFWGFVWEGASSESLSCNALEWQVSEGGGAIIENNAVTVNNPETARAWERALRWVGTISPPGVVSYKEWDAYNIWRAGQAAFMRNWAPPNSGELVQGSLTKDQFGIASLPGGRAKVAATVGGRGYAISRHSLHPREASMLVRFLCRRDTQLNRCLKIGKAPTIPDLYNDPRILGDP
jgi:ABC-type glycerol-3-phosphate transport system substrate-binding protein